MGRSTALALSAAIVLGCAAGPQPDDVPPSDQSVIRALADSTSHLVSHVAFASDTASLQASLAIVEDSLARVQALITRAREAAARANRGADSAIAQGDRLRAIVAPTADGGSQSANYLRYWSLGRAQLDVARARSTLAVVLADSALACHAPACAAHHAAAIRSEMQTAAGAARQAESWVRIATLYVR